MGPKRNQEVMDESMMDFTMDELREFLEADLLDVHVDPEFKERLRRKLWEMVQARARKQSPGGQEH
jgi:hypothetical protein